MANTQQGSKLYISPTPAPNDLTQTEFEAISDWVEIKNIGMLGQAGVQQNILSYDTLDTDVTQKAKGIKNAGDPQVEVARLYSDPGQVAIRAAALTNFNYPFREVRNDAPSAGFTDTTIYNRGLVTGPTRPRGRNEDFDLEIFNLALQQIEIVVDPTSV